MTSPRGTRAASSVLVASLATLALASTLWGQREGRPVAAGRVADAAPAAGAEPPRGRLPDPVPELGAETPAAAPTATPTAAPDVARPTAVRVASVGIRMPVVAKGVTPDGQMALPPMPRALGWYRYGSAPGQPGSTVLAGHVDTRRHGVGPLARLREVEAGDEVAVALSDGRTVRYRVVKVRSIDKRSDALASVFGQDGSSRLRIVTCGGAFDPDAGGYRDNVVLTAVPVRR